MATTNFVAGTLIESTWLNDVDAHAYDQTTGAHAAANISVADAGGTFTATDVEGVLTEIDTDLANHIADTTAAHAASAIANTPAGSIAATTVQAAIDELDAEKQPLDAQLTTLAGITAQQATDLASISTFMGTTLNDADAATFRATTGTEPTLFSETTISVAATTVTITGLDINTHKSYRIEFDIINTAGSNTDYSLYINTDTTATNYYTQVLNVDNATLTATRVNNAGIAAMNTTERGRYEIGLSLIGTFSVANAHGNFASGAGVTQTTRNTVGITAHANITQISFTGTVANSIGIGSKIRIYRGDK